MSLFSLFAGRRPAKASHKPASPRLRLEALEDRTTPSGIDFMGPLAPPCVPTGQDSLAPAGLGADPGSPAGQGVAASSATSRPMKGQGSGNIDLATGDFVATGTATHLGAFRHYGNLTLTPTDDPAVFLISGRTTYEAANGDLLVADLSGTLNFATGVATGTDTWVGESSTGRFAGASGSVQITAQVLPDGSFTFELVEGDISY